MAKWNKFVLVSCLIPIIETAIYFSTTGGNIEQRLKNETFDSIEMYEIRKSDLEYMKNEIGTELYNINLNSQMYFLFMIFLC